MNLSKQGYYRYPTIHQNTIVFAADDDLWQVSKNGGVARRLTANVGRASNPHFSPDGKYIAFTGRDDGAPEVYLMPAEGGEAIRLSHFGSFNAVLGWHNNTILFCSNYEQSMSRILALFSVDMNGGLPQQISVGPARSISYSANGGKVIGRHTRDAAYWKRYKGGTAGVLWVDMEGNGNFSQPIQLDGNFNCPMWIGERIYFIVDHEGIGNIYSCLPTGESLKKHTHHKDYYARNASTDGNSIVYHAGGDIYLFDIASGLSNKVAIDFYSSRVQSKRKFAHAARYLEDYDLNENGSCLSLITRGKAFSMGNWEGAVMQQGERNGSIRYRLSRWLKDGERVVLSSDENDIDQLEVHWINGLKTPKKLSGIDIGRPYDIKVSPTKDEIVLTNHRQELIWVNLTTGENKVLDRGLYGTPFGLDFNWSPDGLWITYAYPISRLNTIIRLYKLASDEKFDITEPVLHDAAPVFDPKGRYLYFISARVFNPVYDNMHFDLNFPNGTKLYAITLQKDTPSPFVPIVRGFDWENEEDEEESEPVVKDKKKEKTVKPISIELEGISKRIVPFPIDEGRYIDITATVDKVYYLSTEIEGARFNDEESDACLKAFDLIELEEKTLVEGIDDFLISADETAMAYSVGAKLRVVATDKDLPKGGSKSRKHGWINLGRINTFIDPKAEWRQMFREAWRLQRDFFWVEDMTNIDWQKVYNRYYPLVERISCRSDLSDIMWEVHGELGTSHAYEGGGDYRPQPRYNIGFLGANFVYDTTHNAYRFTHIVTGDVWDDNNPSPLKRPGVNVQEGMLLLAIGGQPVSAIDTPNKLLINQCNTEITLTVADANKENIRQVTVKTVSEEYSQRYRDWLENNRRYVHEKSNGKLGYVHVPDMGSNGYAEFHRYFLTELDYDGLIVDVRFNGGGHVSQLLLEKLQRKRVGYDLTRWMGIEPYPSESPGGVVVALTNEHAGSDGDIFSHSFKLMNIGKLVGTRTWGGVIGIWPRNPLVDGSGTTQPEFAFWFKDVGWTVENYGTEPDIEVKISPQQHVQGIDPQLDKAIEVALDELISTPPLRPDFGPRPNLSLPS